jgi:hypothetical protein
METKESLNKLIFFTKIIIIEISGGKKQPIKFEFVCCPIIYKKVSKMSEDTKPTINDEGDTKGEHINVKVVNAVIFPN